jgi:hypothetical protein
MTPELQRYYEQRLSMMGEEAWKDLMFDVEQMLAATNDLSSVQDEKMLHFRRGEISIMRWLLSLQSVSEQVYEEKKLETTD